MTYSKEECIRTIKRNLLSKMTDLLEVETYDKDETKRIQAAEKLDKIEKAIEYLEENLK